MTFLRLFNPQGIAGLAASLALAILLVIQKGETRHWHKASDQFETLYRGEQAAFAGTVANYRAAADAARAADAANARRVTAAQNAINQRTDHDYEARLADARARAAASIGRLRLETRAPATDPRAGAAASMPGVSYPAGVTAQAPGEGRLPANDALTATEQAIQLDELIKWVAAQAKVDVQQP